MSFLYPRTITGYRYDIEGDMQYEGNNYSLIAGAQNLPASIQLTGTSGKPSDNLPTEASNETYYNVFVPLKVNHVVIARDLFKKRDMIIDDTGLRYEINGAYWDSLGFNMRCKLMVMN